MNNRLKSTAIMMAFILTISVFTSLAATTAAAAATTPTAEAPTTAVATTTATPTLTATPTAAANATHSVVTSTATTTTITASSTSPTVGSSVTLSVTVKAGSTVLTSKQVTVTHTYPGGTSPGTDGVFDTGSTGTMTFSAGPYGSAGQRVYTASFAGDSVYAASSGTVTVNVGATKTATTTTITASSTSPTVGSSVTLSVTVKAGSTVLTSKQVTVTHTYPGGTSPGTDGVFDTGSTGTMTFSAGPYGSAGQRVYTASFAGDSVYAASSGTVTVNVGATKTATTTTITASSTSPTVGQTVTFTVTLKAGSTGLSAPIKLWYTKDGGPRIDRPGPFSTTNGVYVFSGPFGHTGTYVYHAEFAGDGTYAASSGTVTVNVGATKTATTTTITASSTSPTVGQTVTFTVTLKAGSTGLSAPIKLWYTKDGGPRIDRPGPFSTTNGVYVFSGPFGHTGTYVYHAEFAGDGTYGASSGTITVNVKDKTPTGLTLEASPTTTDMSTPYTLSGQLYINKAPFFPIAGKTIDLWYQYPGDSSWKLGGWTTTNDNGEYSENVIGAFDQYKPYILWRATFDGDSVNYGATSPTLWEHVRTSPDLTIDLSASEVSPGDVIVISGYLKDTAGHGIPGSAIDIWAQLYGPWAGSPNPWYIAKSWSTDANGFYRFEFTTKSVPVETTEIAFYAAFKGDQNYYGQSTTVKSLTLIDHPTLTLASNNYNPPQGTSFQLSGYLKDAQGNGIANAPINIYSSRSDSTWGQPDRTIYTDQNGYYHTDIPVSYYLPGPWYYIAKYTGDADHRGADSNIILVNEQM